MVAILLGVDEQALARLHRVHIVAAVGQIVDRGNDVGLLGVDLLALEGGLDKFALGVVGSLQFLADGTVGEAFQRKEDQVLSGKHAGIFILITCRY